MPAFRTGRRAVAGIVIAFSLAAGALGAAPAPGATTAGPMPSKPCPGDDPEDPHGPNSQRPDTRYCLHDGWGFDVVMPSTASVGDEIVVKLIADPPQNQDSDPIWQSGFFTAAVTILTEGRARPRTSDYAEPFLLRPVYPGEGDDPYQCDASLWRSFPPNTPPVNPVPTCPMVVRRNPDFDGPLPAGWLAVGFAVTFCDDDFCFGSSDEAALLVTNDTHIDISKVELVQSVYTGADSPELVAGKPALVRVTLDNATGAPQTAELTVTMRSSDAAADFTYAKTVKVPAGEPAYLLPCARASDLPCPPAELEPFVPEASPVSVEVTVDTGEVRRAAVVASVTEVAPLELLYVPVELVNVCRVTMPERSDGLEREPTEFLPTQPERAEFAAKSNAYLASLWPIPGVESALTDVPFVFQPGWGAFYFTCEGQIGELVQELTKFAKQAGVDRVVGILPYETQGGIQEIRSALDDLDLSPIEGALSPGFAGVYGMTDFGEAGVIVVPYLGTRSNREMTSTSLAHELGHTYGLPLQSNRVGGKEEYTSGVNGRAASEGVWIDPARVWQQAGVKKVEPGVATAPAWWNFMGSPNVTSDPNETWIALDDYGYLFSVLRSPSRDPEVVQVSGLLKGDGSIAVDPFYTYASDEVSPSVPGGSRHVVLLDSQGNELQRVGFEPDFDPITNFAEVSDPDERIASFTLLVPRPAGLATVRIVEGAEVLFERPVSANPPVVSAIALDPPAPSDGDDVTITWSASDPDGDVLAFTVSISKDGGQTWFPLAQDVPGPSFLWEAPDFAVAADTALIKVQATDGVNSAAAVSAPFAIHNDLHGRLVSLLVKKARSGATASGRVTAIDGYASCVRGVAVEIQRKQGSKWPRVKRLKTQPTGGFRTTLASRRATYRVLASELRLGPKREHVCAAAASAPEKAR